MDTVLSNEDGVLIYTGAPSATDEILAFHYGDFDDAYGDGTVAAAAANGRVYADTLPATLPEEFGIIEVVGTASGQTTYTWTPPVTSLQANVLLVAGGGGGGSGAGREGGGGGGAGGLIYNEDVALSSTNYTISVGQGGDVRTNGVNSSFGASVAIGGGAGGLRADGVNEGADGGSGGGARGASVARAGGSGTAGQGNDGGIAPHRSGGSGGGGASTAGGNSPGNATLGVSTTVQNNEGGNGGQGLFVGVFGETYGENGWFAGGGGGGAYISAGGGIGGTGGIGGGGNGGSSSSVNGTNGTVHTGGGGGGSLSTTYDTSVAGSGGSGIVLVRYIVDTTVIMTRIDSMNFLPQLQGVSGAVTLTDVQEDTALTFNNKSKCVLVASVAIDQSKQGVIYEGGGDGTGFVLYATGGTLYCQGGNGGSVGGSIELSWPIPASFNTSTPTEIGISIEVLASTSRMRMFVNTQQVAQTSTTSGVSYGIAGPNPAGSGQVYGDSIAVCRISSAQGTYTGTINTVNLYPNVYIE